jgi:hypothetical protein
VTTKPLENFVSGLNFRERDSLLLIVLRKLESLHAQTTRPDAKTSLNVLVTVHVTFYCGCLTRQKLVILYHMDIADRFSPKKGGIFDFRSENTTPRITKAHRTLDKQAKTNDGHSLAS